MRWTHESHRSLQMEIVHRLFPPAVDRARIDELSRRRQAAIRDVEGE